MRFTQLKLYQYILLCSADEGKPESNGESEQQPDATTAPQVKKKKLPPLPGGGMKREKTVVEKAAEISDTKKQEMISMMMREQTTMAIKINKEQHRQEELVSSALFLTVPVSRNDKKTLQ